MASVTLQVSNRARRAVTPSVPVGDSRATLRMSHTNELFIAIVAPAGAGAGTVASRVKHFFETQPATDRSFQAEILKASSVIQEWAIENGHDVPPKREGTQLKRLEDMITMQNLGDRMRESEKDNAAVAVGLVRAIRKKRAEFTEVGGNAADRRPRAYILDSLRHPAEVQMLRRLYGDAFCLIGVVCDPKVRQRRLEAQYYGLRTPTDGTLEAFMTRDANAIEKHGQHVTDTFHEADFFIDNSIKARNLDNIPGVTESVRRLIGILAGTEAVPRPTIAETAMHHAYSAQLRSSCLSRQVGAALVDSSGNVVATGANEVPMAGGGVYGEAFGGDVPPDDRCAYRPEKYCSSNREQNQIIDELIYKFPILMDGRTKAQAVAEIRNTRIGGLIEFSRAVHAEMDAILSAARTGVSPKAKRLFVTAFPCHYCARHIVASGIDEVQFIEPYPKSRATDLHRDAITTTEKGWVAPSEFSFADAEPMRTTEDDEKPEENRGKVLFRPFVGMSPRMYERAFLKNRSLKDKLTGEYKVGEPDWGGMSDVFDVSYFELEERLETAREGRPA